MGSQNWGSSHWHGDREALRGPGEVGPNRLCHKADRDRLGRVRKPMWGWGQHGGSNRIQQQISQSTRYSEGKHCLILHLLFPVRGECGRGKGRHSGAGEWGSDPSSATCLLQGAGKSLNSMGQAFHIYTVETMTATHRAVRSPLEINTPATLKAGPARVSSMGGPL